MAGSKRARRTPDLRLIRRSVTYSVPEISELLGLHVNTVRSWVKDGLPTIDDSRPYLIHGADLYSFLKKRMRSRKSPCGDGEMFCFRCRAPRRPVAGSAIIASRRKTTLTISGACEACGSKMNRAGASARLGELCRAFGIVSMPQEHLTGQGTPLDRCDLSKEVQDGAV